MAGSIVLTSGCKGSDAISTPHPQRSLAEVVTPEVAEHLRSGIFDLESPLPGPVPEIDRQQAEAIAKAWLITFAPYVRSYLERRRGGRIDLERLRPCGRTLYGESPYEPPAPDLARDPRLQPTIRGYGPFWLVTLCTPAGSPEVGLGVSAYSTDLVVAPDGTVGAPGVSYQGNWFVWDAIPINEAKRFLLTPEEAALRAADSTGARIASVPRLVAPAGPRTPSPLYARWQMALDRPVRLRPIGAGDAVHSSRELWVGFDISSDRIRFLSADPVQPATDSVRYPSNTGPNTRRGDKIEYAWYYARRRPDVPVRLSPVAVDSVARGPN